MNIIIGIGLPIGTDFPSASDDISGGLDNLLLETGDHFLLESAADDVLLLE